MIKIPKAVLAKVRRISLAKIRWFLIYYPCLLSGAMSTLTYKIVYGNSFSIKSGSKVWGKYRVLILGDGTIEIGERFHCVSDRNRYLITLFSPVHLTAVHGGAIVIGDSVQLNGTAITAVKRITIGDGTMIAANTIIVDSDFHRPWPPTSRWSSESDGKEVTIGKHVWIGMNVTILKGVTIGDNALIAAGSVVSSDIEPNCLAAGNPAKKIKSYIDTHEVVS